MGVDATDGVRIFGRADRKASVLSFDIEGATGYTTGIGWRSDKVSEDMLIERMQVHEQNAWMLRAIIADTAGDSRH